MATDRLDRAAMDANPLGTFLKDCRARLDPKAFGFTATRRRTPGLRREEVAQLAAVSATWYTWLEQGRGGVPSVEVLDQIADALALSSAEREYLFLLAQGRPPEIREPSDEEVTPQLQRLLDSMELCPAYIRTATWDIVAWNRAASKVLTDYGALPPEERNLLCLMFGTPSVRQVVPDWEAVARRSVAAFRADAARAGASAKAKALVERLCRLSPEFEAIWRHNEVGVGGAGSKHLMHAEVGLIALEYSSFAIDGRPNLGMVVFNPVTPDDAARIRLLVRP